MEADGTPKADPSKKHERELTADKIRKVLKNSSARGDLVDYLISKQVFEVGAHIQCPVCTRRSWYRTKDIDSIISYPKCLNEFPAIGNIEKSYWRYRITGPFSVPDYANWAHATLLALNFFSGHVHVSSMFKTTSALSFEAERADGQELEADIALIWEEDSSEKQSGLLFAECKTYNEFTESDFKKIVFLAQEFPGAVIAFTTLRSELTKDELSEIKKIAVSGRTYWKNEKPRNPVLILTGNELFSDLGLPADWEDSGVAHRYERGSGFLNICDATHQIYLGLPSWQDEWHDLRSKSGSSAKIKKRRHTEKAVR